MEYELQLNDNDMEVLNNLLMDAPYKVAAPLINKINKQIQERRANVNTDK